MRSKLLALAIAVSALFYGVIPLLYLFPHVAGNRIVGTVMLTVAFVVVGPTWVAIVVRVCSLGLRTGGISRRKGIQV